MRNKKGDLRDNIGDMIIGILCLLLIIGAVMIIYKVFANQEDANAKRVVTNIEAKINNLNDGESNTFLIQGFPEAGEWFLAGWGKEEKEKKPDPCTFQSCICICEGTLAGFSPSKISLAEQCSVKGFCRRFNIDKIVVERDVANFIGLSPYHAPGEMGPPSPGVEKSLGNKICTGFQLRANMIEVKIMKDKNEIKVLQSVDEEKGSSGNCF